MMDGGKLVSALQKKDRLEDDKGVVTTCSVPSATRSRSASAKAALSGSSLVR